MDTMKHMKQSLLALSLLAIGGAGGWALAHWTQPPAAAGAAAAAPVERQVLYWYDPMVPTQKFDKPGKSPFMDMELVPRYADEGAAAAAGGLVVAAGALQSLGLRTATVEQRAIAPAVAVTGSVMLNERDISLLQTRSAAFVERVHAHAPGDVVAAGSPLAELLVPEWVAAQREFLAVRALGDAALTAAARQRLLLLGMSESLVADLERSGTVQQRSTVRVPRGGLIAELTVREGMTLPAGATLARVQGLDRVWVEAAVPEAQAGLLANGRSAELRLAAFPGEALTARVIAVLPEGDAASRTVRVRLELPNPGQRLRAGMSGEVRFAGQERSALVVPSEAVIRTGRRALVYVVDGPGRFHPVEVRLGAEVDDQLVVEQGLVAGQQLVASAQFLIDSEASLRGLVPAAAAEASR